MQRSEGNEQPVFVIEVFNRTDSGWHTRNDPAKYEDYFNRVSSAIAELIPNAITMRNQIPKSYLHYDLYCNLIPNDDPNVNAFHQIPRTGAFEVSYQGNLIFSKLKGGYWPNCELVASKCAGIVDAIRTGNNVDQFLAGNQPAKDGSLMRSSVKKTRGGSPSKSFQNTSFSETKKGRSSGTNQMVQPTALNFDNEPDFALQQAQPEPAQQEQVQEEEVQAGAHLQSPNSLTGKPIFRPGEDKSLLCKFLTQQVWDKLKNHADPYSFTFKEAIFSGCKNPDSGIGVYAGSAESYNSFADLFVPIIEDYHKYSLSRGHTSNMDASQLNAPPFAPEDAAMIKSTRIRVGRNLADFPLGPAITREQRNIIEQKVVEACSSFTGELAGTYYSLNSLTEAQRQQLIADHFLFKEGDRFLDACGLNRNWPEGRGIFHNNEKTFLVWVNEEDQLRIISMQNGADIGAVFRRLATAAAAIEKVARFSHNNQLGYITSCPTNLGTALRASVHIALPNLGQRKQEFEAIADRFKVQIRGIHGEHSESADHVYDISNKRRLGLSEVELVQDMYNGVKAMIEREKELRPAEEETKCGSHLRKAADIGGFPVFPPGTESLLSKCMTRDIWNQLKDKQDGVGFSFREAILSGCQNTDSGIGVYAGSHDSYTAFAPLMDKIILEYHGHAKGAQHVSDMDHTKLRCPPFAAADAAMIKSTRIRVGRNLAEFPLGPGVTREQRNAIEQKVVQACSAFEGELAGRFYSLGSMSEADRQQLIADHFLFKEGDRFLDACGLNREWPEGRGIFHNNEKTFLVWVNEEDQLRIISMQNGADIGAVFSRLATAAAKIEQVARFAHDPSLGYITSCPTNLGTALRASVHIALPNLGPKKAEFQAIADRYHVQIRGIHGEHSESADHVYDISNKRRLGRSEVDLVQDMYDGVKAMIEAEKALAGGQAPVAQPAADVQCGPTLKKHDQLTGFPVFPAGTKSLLCKNLDRELWDQLKDKSDSGGFTFKEAILSGCQNTDSGIGVYAGSHDSYTAFAPMFDRIIEQYHGHGKTAQHVSDMDHTKLQCPPFSPADASMIKSTRIRVGRNLANYPLGPGVTREQRNEIEQKVVQACSQFDGDLAGTFYSLSSMTDAQRQQLIDDHFLFKEGDRFLDACGLNRNWPEGRGIFHNNTKTFLVWVNEEDQLRIISMEQGADIGGVFSRLARAANKIETVASFSRDDHLGYITSCPTNLGTALRASVHIALPKLGAKMADFEAIANQYNVQIRGIHGEHSESADHVYDISNKRRLGLSEVQLVQDMYNGVKAMIEKEKELGGGGVAPVVEEEVKAGNHLRKPEDLTGFPVFPEGTTSLLSKNLTREIWDQLKDKSDSHGVSFKTAILSGCQNIDSGIGVYAGSHDSYTAFAPLMDKIIQQYHGHAKGAPHVSDMDHTKLRCPPFSAEDAAMIKSTRIRVGRNLAEFPLGPGITKQQRNEIEQKVVQACASFEGELAGTFYSLGSMTEAQRQQLVADHFLFKEGDRFLDACGLNRDWPEGRGIFHNNEKTFLVWVNEEDQLRIISMQNGADIGAVFSRLATAAGKIEQVASFAHDPSLGYITSCPTNLGTALRASVHIALPNLGVKMDQFQAIADQFHVQIRGIHGEHSESADHVYDISNKRRLGRSEVALVQDMYDGVKAMIEKEKELRGAAGGATAAAAQASPGGDVTAGPHLRSVDDLTGFPTFPEGTTSLLSQHLTRDIWNQLKDTNDSCGFNFKAAILSGCQNVDSGIGVYAGSHNSYTAFAPLMDKIIEQYHGHAKGARHVSNMDHTQLQCPPFDAADAAMIKSTRIRVGRNLADYPLGPGVSKVQREEIMAKVVQACQAFEGELAGTFYPIEGMEEATQKQLIADHFLFKEGDRFLEACGLNRDWPSGRGIFHNAAKSFLVWVNEEDQLRIISMQMGADIGAVFSRLAIAAAKIEEIARFAHDESLGYITSCPTNLGTALRASVHIALPKLGTRKEEFKAIADQFHVQIRGIHGEHSESADHVYDISNKRRLGRSEVDLVQDMYNGVKAMIEKEKQL